MVNSINRNNNIISIKNIVIFTIMIAAAATFLNYRGFGRENQIAEFPIIYRAMDGNYLTNDFYTNRASEFGPRYLYAKIIAFIATEGSLPLVAILLTLLINISIALITFFFTRDIMKGSRLAGVLAVVLVMTIKTFNLGYWSHIYARQVLSSYLAVPFIFASFFAAFRCRPYLLAFTSGIAVLIHPTFGAECGILAFLVLLTKVFGGVGTFFQKGSDSPKAGCLKLAAAIVIFLIFVSIPLIPYLSLERIETQQFMEIETFFRHPHHSVPSLFRIGDYAAAFFFLLVSGLAWFWVNRQDRTFPFITIVILLLCFCGYIFVEVFPLRLMAIARPFRLLFIIKWLGLIMAAGAIAHFTRLKLKWALTPVYKLRSFVFYAVVIGVGVMMILLSIIYYTPNKILPKRAVAVLRGIMPEVRYLDIRTQEVEAARYALDNTAQGAVFLTPPDFGKFRLVGKRAMVVDWRSFPFQDQAMVEWRQRLFDCYGIPGAVGLAARNEMKENYKRITDAKIIKLKKKYGFTYVVLNEETDTGFPVIYKNRKYKIVSLQVF